MMSMLPAMLLLQQYLLNPSEVKDQLRIFAAYHSRSELLVLVGDELSTREATNRYNQKTDATAGT